MVLDGDGRTFAQVKAERLGDEVDAATDEAGDARSEKCKAA